MAKKIRFPLEMENGVEVRSMEELREKFSLAKILEYRANGKLIIWLRDRYANDIADAIEQISPLEENLAKKVSEIFDIQYDEKTEDDLERAKEKAKRVKRLKQYTNEKKYIAEIDKLAFSQDELFDLLDENEEKIYLCGDKFSIPLAKAGISYIGINRPIVLIDSKVEVNWDEKQITVENVVFDDKYQAVIDSANKTKEKLYEKVVEAVKKKPSNTLYIGEYSDKTFLNFMISPAEKNAVKKMYEKARVEIEKLNYDVNADVLSKKQLTQKNKLIGLADSYLNSL